jgi:hypothetical protein
MLKAWSPSAIGKWSNLYKVGLSGRFEVITRTPFKETMGCHFLPGGFSQVFVTAMES